MNYHILYFAALRDAAGCDSEQVAADTTDARDLYAQLRARYGFALAHSGLRIAVNGAFTAWERPLREGDEVVFIPPVSGG